MKWQFLAETEFSVITVYETHAYGTKSEINLLTYSMQQSPSLIANRFSASQEITRFLWNLKIHYRIHKRQPPVPILSQINPSHAPQHTSRISISILSSHLRLGLPSVLFPSGFPTKTLYTTILSPIRATRPTHLMLLDLIIQILCDEQYRSLSSSLCSFPHSPVT